MDGDGWIDGAMAVARRLVEGLDGAPAAEGCAASLIHGSGGGALGSAVVRLRGPDGAWSCVAKLVRRTATEPQHRDWWGREPAAYGSSWLRDRLPDGLVMPACLAAAEVDVGAVVLLEDVAFDDRDRRDAAWYGALARTLGALHAVGPDAGAPPWLSSGFHAVEARRTTDLAPAALTDPPATLRGVHDRWGDAFRRVATHAPALAAWLGTTPVGLAHLDASSRNVARPADVFVAIDWALAGWAPLATDAAALVGITLMHGDLPGTDVAAFEAAVVDGYATGARAAGSPATSDDVADAYAVALSLRLARFLTEVDAVMRTDPQLPAAIAGRPIGDVLAAWEALAAHAVPHADRALDLVA